MTCIRASWAGGGGVSVLVHGGAGAREGEDDESDGCVLAAERAFAILAAGGTALDAVQAAVVTLEDDPRYNAGVGAALTEDGDVELDAAIMDGFLLRAGAVCALRHHRNAIVLARRKEHAPSRDRRTSTKSIQRRSSPRRHGTGWRACSPGLQQGTPATPSAR
jgi:hypothetical protein